MMTTVILILEKYDCGNRSNINNRNLKSKIDGGCRKNKTKKAKKSMSYTLYGGNLIHNNGSIL